MRIDLKHMKVCYARIWTRRLSTAQDPRCGEGFRGEQIWRCRAFKSRIQRDQAYWPHIHTPDFQGGGDL